MNMFKVTEAKTPEEYIAKIAEPRKSEIIKLDQIIRQSVPDLKPYIISGMIGYGSYHYKYASGREGDWCIIALASKKNYISVYICASDQSGYVAEKHKADFPKASIGKSCIRFKKLADIDLDLLATVIKKGAKLQTNSQ